jgi:hypothetical protein
MDDDRDDVTSMIYDLGSASDVRMVSFCCFVCVSSPAWKTMHSSDCLEHAFVVLLLDLLLGLLLVAGAVVVPVVVPVRFELTMCVCVAGSLSLVLFLSRSSSVDGKPSCIHAPQHVSRLGTLRTVHSRACIRPTYLHEASTHANHSCPRRVYIHVLHIHTPIYTHIHPYTPIYTHIHPYTPTLAHTHSHLEPQCPVSGL